MRIRANGIGSLLLWACLAGHVSAMEVARGDRYVSMGSSYAAGPGVGNRDASSGECARSRSNYAQQVARRHGLKLIDVSCSGAVTENILHHGQHGFPAQIDAVTADTRLVTVLIGGNDIGYVADLNGLTCQHLQDSHCMVLSTGDVDRRLAALPDALQRVVDEIRRRSRDAMIILVGYLPAVPAEGADLCAAVPLSAADVSRMRSETARLADVMATVASHNGIGWVSSTDLGKRNDACSSRPYIAGYRPDRQPDWPAPVPYHPTQRGMTRVAEEIDRVLSSRIRAADRKESPAP